MGYPHGADRLPCRDQPRRPGRRPRPPIRGAKRGANVGSRQATSGDNQPWLVQLDGPSGHAQQHEATERMRLKSGRPAVRSPPLTTSSDQAISYLTWDNANFGLPRPPPAQPRTARHHQLANAPREPDPGLPRPPGRTQNRTRNPPLPETLRSPHPLSPHGDSRQDLTTHRSVSRQFHDPQAGPSARAGQPQACSSRRQPTGPNGSARAGRGCHPERAATARRGG